MHYSSRRTYLIVLLFSIAMGFLEAVVVVYLRKIAYPHGFEFPLVLLPPKMYWIEVSREFATLVMLFTLSLIAGKNKLEQFACFLFAFAVWDIIYYVGLKLMLGWPPSMMTWDILFLIPIPWSGPVLAPVISSLSMILLALGITRGQQKIHAFRIRLFEWDLLISGAFIVFCSFIWDYASLILNMGFAKGSRTRLTTALSRFIPNTFHWSLFILGEALISATIIILWKRVLSAPKSH